MAPSKSSSAGSISSAGSEPRRRRIANSLIASFVLHGVALGGGVMWLRPLWVEARTGRASAELFVESPREVLLAELEPQRELVSEPLEFPLPVSEPQPFESALEEEPPPAHHPDGEWHLARNMRPHDSLILPESEPPETAPLAPALELDVIDPAPASAAVHAPEPEIASTAVVPTDNRAPKYPRVSVQRGEEGSVLVAMRIALDGTVMRAWVLETSGHRRLDRAALDAVADWRFRPATKNGQAIECEHSHRLTFRLTST